jgi:hypothetical protein
VGEDVAEEKTRTNRNKQPKRSKRRRHTFRETDLITFLHAVWERRTAATAQQTTSCSCLAFVTFAETRFPDLCLQQLHDRHVQLCLHRFNVHFFSSSLFFFSKMID